MPGAAQAAPTWLAPGSFTDAKFPAVAVNDDGTAALAAESGSGTSRIIKSAIHTPGIAGFGGFDPLSPSGNNGWSSVDVNTRGDVVVGWDDNTRAWAAIKPAGGSWGAPIDLGPATSAIGWNTQVQIADNGDVVASWQQYNGATYVMQWAIKPAGGTFGTPTSVLTTNSSYGPPRLAMNAAGDAVVTWTQYDGAHWSIRAASRPAGGAFGAPVTLSDTSQNATYPYPAVSDNGGAAVLWSRSNGTHTVAQISRRPAASGDFGVAVNLSPSSADVYWPSLAINGSGDLLAIWLAGGDVQARLGSLTDAFDPIADFEPAWSPPSAAISDSGAAVVTWGAEGNVIRASRRAPGAAFRAPFDASPGPVSFYANVIAAPVGMDANGDIVVTWMQNSFADTGYRVYDAAGPRLDGLSMPGSATAGQAAAFSVAPLDAFSAVASTHWDFGDGVAADGASVSHTYNSPGSYTVKVTATDAVGNATSATNTITVASAPVSPPPPAPPVPPTPKVMCKVPNLKGSTLAKAKKKLTAAHCKLGKVTTPKKLRKAKGLVILKQLPKAGTTKAEGFKVSVTLGKKPKARRR